MTNKQLEHYERADNCTLRMALEHGLVLTSKVVGLLDPNLLDQMLVMQVILYSRGEEKAQ